jgi:Flp pilus assembly protein TadG
MRRLRSMWRGDDGAALIEAAFVLPLLLFVSIGIIEFGRAFQTWQVVTNAAREGARIAVLPGMTDDDIKARVNDYMKIGVVNPATAEIAIDRTTTVSLGGTTTASASRVQVDYPYTFMVLQPIAELVVKGSTVGAPLTMRSAATMRNE